MRAWLARSLRLQIAVSFSALLLGATLLVALLLAWALQAILLAEVQSRTDATANEIVQQASSNNPFTAEAFDQSPLDALLSPGNLASWQSPTTFVQIDNANGYPLAKSPNLGSNSFPSPVGPSAKRNTYHGIVEVASRPYFVTEHFHHVDAKTSVVIIVGEPLDQLYRAFTRIREAIFAVVIIVGIAIVLISFALARRTVRPIETLASAMQEIAADKLDTRLGWEDRRDEIGVLASSFDGLLERLEEAFARERQFISDASHELKTPLTSINANAQMLLRWGDENPEIRAESLQTIVRESTALANMVSGMLTLAKADRGERIAVEPLSLSSVARDAVQSTAPRAREKGLDLRFDFEQPAPLVLGEPTLLRQIIGNLIDNAIKFTETGEVRVHVGTDGAMAVVVVEDTGSGIPDDALGNIFERFYRADKAHSRDTPGTGLGLAIVRSVARAHGGEVTAEHAALGGARLTIRLPRLDATLTEHS
ncbi:MAG: sensor histidine kinase [Vulcanimicrobiaceae bacterium]